MEKNEKNIIIHNNCKKLKFIFPIIQRIIVCSYFILTLYSLFLFINNQFTKFEAISLNMMAIVFATLLYSYIKETKEKVVKAWMKK